jgi:hypothetical protein
MRNFRDRLRTMSIQQAMELPLIPGPDPDKMKAIIGSTCYLSFLIPTALTIPDRTGYQLEVTVGQRKYHSPPGYEGPDPNLAGDGGCVS